MSRDVQSRLRRRLRGGARVALVGLLASATAGCLGKLDHLGKAPTMSPVAGGRDVIDPTLPTGSLEIATSPIGDGRALPPPPASPYNPRPAGVPAAPHGAPHYATASLGGPGVQGASLWSSGPRSLFGDRRARRIGDILTVLIEINDSAAINNNTTRTRSGSDSVTASTVYGLESVIDRIIPGDAVGLANGVNTNGDSTSTGDGTITRDETISLRIAGTVVDVLPNGHLVVTGNQEVRVNFELRDLQIAGVIRPEDITRQNTITYDKMANARISYGGRGQITDFQQPRIGQQIVDLISPF